MGLEVIFFPLDKETQPRCLVFKGNFNLHVRILLCRQLGYEYAQITPNILLLLGSGQPNGA